MRRARQAISDARDGVETPCKKRKANTDLKEFVLKRWTSAKPFTDKGFATLAYFHGKDGGDTLAEFATNPNKRGEIKLAKLGEHLA